MTCSPVNVISTFVNLDQSQSQPLYQQLSRNLRRIISEGSLSPGARLPSTRALADELEISRNTIRSAYEQLQSEGYIESQVGSGSYVSTALPERYTTIKGTSEPIDRSLKLTDTKRRTPSVSKRSQRIAELPHPRLDHPCTSMAFRPGLPALDAFPIETWSTLVSRRWRSLPPTRLVYGDPMGFRPLRELISEHLREARGVRCGVEQILIVSGIQQALTLTARVLLDPDDPSWVEDPGYPPMREAFTATGSEPCPVPVDEEGLNIVAKTDRLHAGGGVSSQEKSDQAPKLVGVTPSHQFPLGVTMSLSRRLDLLEWAAQTQTWIFEDDYDSEYQYSGHPIAALQGLDNGERVIYAGTFSKVLFPALRLGYIVVPPDLVDTFTKMRSLSDRCPPRVQQMALADFMEEGHFDEHIRRMRTLYASRQSILLKAIDQNLSNLIEIEASDAGLHLVGWLPNDVDDQVISKRLENAGIVAPPLSYYSQRKKERGGLLLGYASVSEEEILDGVSRMTETLKSF